MLSHRRDPYLWIHLAGLATVPVWLDGCLVGLAVGEPLVPPWLELATLGAVGTLPILWMQLQRPFYIFSVPGLALRPDKLSTQRRRLLTMQRGWFSRALVLMTAIALWGALYVLYQLAPVTTDIPWLAGQSRATGWGICAIAFLFANLFTLVPATIVPLFLASPRRLETIEPFAATQILQKFTVTGLRLGKILPEVATKESADEDPGEFEVAREASSASGARVADNLAARTTAKASPDLQTDLTTVADPSNAATHRSPASASKMATNQAAVSDVPDATTAPASAPGEQGDPAAEPDVTDVGDEGPPLVNTTEAWATDAAPQSLLPESAEPPAPAMTATSIPETSQATSTPLADESAIARHDANGDSTFSPADTSTIAAPEDLTDAPINRVDSLEDILTDEGETAQGPGSEDTFASHNGAGSLNSPESDET